MKVHYSVIIVGAGPAGSTLARLIDSQNQSVLIIDGYEKRGGKVCAGLLSPDAQDLLAKYDICLPSDILVSPQLFSVRTIDLEYDTIRYYRRNYMNMDRKKFDRFLYEMIPDQVDKISGSCICIKRCEKGFELKLLLGRKVQIVTCDYVVGADGASSIVRSCLFPEKKIQRYTSIQQWFEAGDENPYYSCIFDNDTSPSCSWIFFKDGKLVFGGAFEPKGCRKAFEKQKEKLVKRGIVPANVFQTPIKTEACMVARPHFFEGIYTGADGAFLLGEAAGFISPSSLEGISFAMASAEKLAKAFGAGKNQEDILKKYRKGILKLKIKVRCKCIKRPFMYHQILRRLVLKSGITSIKVKVL